MGTLIENVQDLADYLGANEATEDSISRRIYKDTACGAWARLRDVPVSRERQKWTAFFRWTEGRIEVIEGVCCGRVISPADFPEIAVEAVCGLNREGDRWFSKLHDPEEIAAAVHTIWGWEDGTLMVEGREGTFELSNDAFVTAPGVEFGTIIEGSDAYLDGYTAVFPFDSDVIDKMLDDLESEAARLWEEANGTGEDEEEEELEGVR